jgi:hypothetical protein
VWELCFAAIVFWVVLFIANMSLGCLQVVVADFVLGHAAVFRCMERQREQRLQLRVDRMRLQSTIFWLQQELKDARQQLRAEQRQQHQLAGRLRELQHARLAKSGAQQWQLSGVQLYFNKVVQAQAVPVSGDQAAAAVPQQSYCHDSSCKQAAIAALCSSDDDILSRHHIFLLAMHCAVLFSESVIIQ